MLRLERIQDLHLLRVSGRIDAENLAELKMQMQVHPSPMALELAEVTLVDVDAVRFLATAEAAGMELRNCPLYIREWIRRDHPDLAELEQRESARVHVFGRNDGTQVNLRKRRK